MSIDFLNKVYRQNYRLYLEKGIRWIELLYLSSKQLHFTFNNNIYIQCDGVPMGSPLGPLLANVFMTWLKEDLIPTLKPCLCNWKRYLNDTHAYVEPLKVEFILKQIKYLSCIH